MKINIKIFLMLGLISTDRVFGQLSKAAQSYEIRGQVKPTPSTYFRASGLPLLVGTSIILANTPLMRHPMGAALAIPLSTGTAGITAYWVQNRWEKALARQESTLQEELARHYILTSQNEAELAKKLDKLNLLSAKQKAQLQARIFHAQEAFQNPSLMALLSNS
ncbi:MAG: hypothetical protein K2X90_02520 [Candidatus Babeliaceae bacterium]|nr:hypothetical protein [Candidatus Babeliaceae bacterium]